MHDCVYLRDSHTLPPPTTPFPPGRGTFYDMETLELEALKGAQTLLQHVTAEAKRLSGVMNLAGKTILTDGNLSVCQTITLHRTDSTANSIKYRSP